MRSHSIPARREGPFRGALSLFALLLALLAGACIAPADGRPDAGEPDPRDAAMADPAYHAASLALSQRRIRRAEGALAPALQDPERRTPWLLLLAAEVAAADGRWARVDSLLEPAAFADPRAVAAASLLLARSALERSAAPRAREHARQALAGARTEAMRGQALVFLARAHERLGARDSARIAYTEAAARLGLVGDWLVLRAAALTADSAARAAHYRGLRTPAAQRRAHYAEAQLLERRGRARAAIPLYERAEAPLQAARLRAALATGAAQRDSVRRSLVAFVEANSGTPEARSAVEMLDAGRYRLTANEELIVARSAVRHGPLSRARAGVHRAFAVRAPSDEERLFQAAVLAAGGPAGRRDADRLLGRFRKTSPYAGTAALERAKLVRRRGRTEPARAALRAVVREHPDDTAAASGALLLLAEMATDQNRDAAARDAYLTLARRYPTSEHAAHARFHAGILAYAARRYTLAAAELDTAAALHPGSPDGTAARYWSARARAALRDTAGARHRWEILLATDPMSYYAAQGARRLGTTPWAPPASPDTFAHLPEVELALARAEQLERLGMRLEAQLELDALAAAPDTSTERLLAVAAAFRERGDMRHAMELGRRAIALGAVDARAWRLVYPVGELDLVLAEASHRGVDPALVAAVIRHESSFEQRATSPVGARGLMQVMPAVGRELARSERITPWDPAMLYDPDINVRLGVVHLRSFTRHYGSAELALAAYNAGPGRVARWRTRPGGRDPELFVERIRFTETRGYVRNVIRSRDMYAALYDWERLAGAE